MLLRLQVSCHALTSWVSWDPNYHTHHHQSPTLDSDLSLVDQTECSARQNSRVAGILAWMVSEGIQDDLKITARWQIIPERNCDACKIPWCLHHTIWSYFFILQASHSKDTIEFLWVSCCVRFLMLQRIISVGHISRGRKTVHIRYRWIPHVGIIILSMV